MQAIESKNFSGWVVVPCSTTTKNRRYDRQSPSFFIPVKIQKSRFFPSQNCSIDGVYWNLERFQNPVKEKTNQQDIKKHPDGTRKSHSGEGKKFCFISLFP